MSQPPMKIVVSPQEGGVMRVVNTGDGNTLVYYRDHLIGTIVASSDLSLVVVLENLVDFAFEKARKDFIAKLESKEFERGLENLVREAALTHALNRFSRPHRSRSLFDRIFG